MFDCRWVMCSFQLGQDLCAPLHSHPRSPVSRSTQLPPAPNAWRSPGNDVHSSRLTLCPFIVKEEITKSILQS